MKQFVPTSILMTLPAPSNCQVRVNRESYVVKHFTNLIFVLNRLAINKRERNSRTYLGVYCMCVGTNTVFTSRRTPRDLDLSPQRPPISSRNGKTDRRSIKKLRRPSRYSIYTKKCTCGSSWAYYHD